MASTYYRVKTKKSLNSIYLRFKQGNQFDIEVSTGIKVPKGKWSSKSQKINPTERVDYLELNKKLRNLKVSIENQYSSDSVDGVIINSKWLKFKIDTFLNRETKNPDVDKKVFFYSFMDYFISQAKKRVNSINNPIKYRTVQHYQTTKNKIEAYQKYSGSILKLSDINLTFHSNFIEFLEIEQQLNPNTIGGYVDVIKQVCGKAELKEYNVCTDYKSSDFYTPANKTLDTYLTIKEIHKLYNNKFKTDYLDNARDWLIISVWTGLRVSDLLSLTNDNINGDFIEKDTLKTKFPVIIPLHNQVKLILKKRKGKFPRRISDQKYNEYIKIVCKDVGINDLIKGSIMSPIEKLTNGKKEIIYRKKPGKYAKHKLITSHIGRRSFATNHYGKLDSLTLMKITGHKTEKQFLDYIKITPKEYAEKLKIYWEKINYDEFVNS